MISLQKCQKLFLDFDGVIVDSNRFKEIAIKESIFQLFGENELSIKAVDYFNINAGISRKKKLSLFFEENKVSRIMKSYSRKCDSFFLNANPTPGLKQFLDYITSNYKDIKIFILSGGEKKEIQFFLRRHGLEIFFEDILASNLSKIEHLKNKGVTKNDIFLGDSKNDFETSLKSDLRFILIEEYKSLKSFPKEDSIKDKILLKTQNFQSLLKLIK